ncbi:colanic acid biosynthesis acetyltransferase WcaF [Terrimonas sp.]|uniref:WcaF family extracellular polysaccharide biosynthesis acetyltransferase n=1 Tax=Terrimonas sp. TaxID=1914338 RepID=UPI000D50DB6F|nr:WcaF family extracellular polysaccharide biosynthesis acetyltransferase [Terrimonas sp.]PVD52036.1 colanic acid biosynthesis acetyltransferase WcaF [Terrimonas sp.]
MTTVDLSQYNNDWYKPTIGAGILKRGLWYIVNVLFFINPLNPLSGFKCWLLKCFGAKLGQGVVIKPGVNIKYPWKLKTGDHVWVGEKVWIDNLADIVIGNNVCISQGAMLLTGNHNYKKISFDLMVAGIHLEDGVWIGARAVVCPGVTAYSHSVLTVASVSAKNMEAYTVYSGNPAVPVKQRIIE